jgi:hypothetical protein
MNIVQIKPTNQIMNITFCQFAIQHIQIRPFFDAVITVIITDNKNDDITKTLYMNTEEYKNWGSDDNYLVYWIANKFGFELTEDKYKINPFYVNVTDIHQVVPPPPPSILSDNTATTTPSVNTIENTSTETIVPDLSAPTDNSILLQ